MITAGASSKIANSSSSSYRNNYALEVEESLEDYLTFDVLRSKTFKSLSNFTLETLTTISRLICHNL